MDRERGERAEDQGQRSRSEADLDRQRERPTDGVVVQGGVEPPRAEGLDRPRLDALVVERVQGDDPDRDVQEQKAQDRRDPEGPPAGHGCQSASNAPSRRAARRYAPMITIGTTANAAANGM